MSGALADLNVSMCRVKGDLMAIHQLSVQTQYTQIIKPVIHQPLEDNEEVNHSQHRFVRSKPIFCFDRVIGSEDTGEGWALVERWL